MKKTPGRSSPQKKTTTKVVSKTAKKKNVSLKKFDYESYPVKRLSYAEYVRRHALAHSILDEIED